MNWWVDCIKVENMLSERHQQENVKTIWEKITAKDKNYSTYKELLKLNNEKTNNLIKKWAKNLNRYLTKENMPGISWWSGG